MRERKLGTPELTENEVDDYFHVRHLERPPLGTSYSEICERVALLASHSSILDYKLVVDATGVGRPVVEMLRKYKLNPVEVTITSGVTATFQKDGYHVPKRDLVSCLLVLLETGRFKIARGLAEADVLVKELKNMRISFTAKGKDTYEAQSGRHDDLVLSVALGCWYGMTIGGSRRQRNVTPDVVEYNPLPF